MEKYQNICEQARNFSDTNDCTVKALALLADISYEEAHKACEKIGGRTLGDGLTIKQLRKVFHEFGLSLHVEHVGARTVKKLIVTGQVESDKRYLVGSTRHVSAVVDGKVEDWAANRKKFIDCVYQVIPNGVKKSKVPADVVDARKARESYHMIKEPQRGSARAIWDYLNENAISETTMNAFNRKGFAYDIAEALDIKYMQAYTEVNQWSKYMGLFTK